MRRIIAAVLLVLFLGQSSGIALAAQVTSSNISLTAQLAMAVAPILSAIQSSQIVAIFEGQGNRYAAMHAPAPDFFKIQRAEFIPPSTTLADHHVAARYVGNGILVRTQMASGSGAQGHSDPLLKAKQPAPAVCPLSVRRMALSKGIHPQVLCCTDVCGTPTPPTPTPQPTLAPTPTPAPTATPCPAGWAGSAPSCVPPPTPCPAGWSGSAPNCVPPPTPCPAGWFGTPPNCTAPTPAPTPQPALKPSGTGINRWWTYEEGNIPGAGKWMVNVATSNLIVQDDDIDVPERGVDLAFRRTYNSQSQHDYANTDGSVASNYGNGWTNTFDAHLAYNANSSTFSVYDIDGTRYDYQAVNGQWIVPPGMQGTSFAWDGGCGYLWTKKNGTRYWFWSPVYNSCAGTNTAGYNGRLYMIQGRNRNNWVRFDYYWDGGIADSAAHVNQINALHADGHYLVLRFSDSYGHRLLHAITRPDNQNVVFAYDANGNLTDVCDIGNGSTDGSPNAASICGDTTHQHHRYYFANGSLMYWADSPNWTMSWGGPNAAGSGGGYVSFNYVGGWNGAANQVQYVGYANFRPNDGTNTLLQPGYTDNTNNAGVIRTLAFSNNNLALGNPGVMSFTDTDGHATTWSYDGVERVTQTSEYTGAAENIWLVTSQCWDSSSNLTCARDPRGSETDYGYDANGNTSWVQQPPVQSDWGLIRPVVRYSYDQYNNLLAYCDAVYVGKTGATTCPSTTGTTHFGYDYSDATNEPYGRLSDYYSPVGYHRWYSYNTSGQQGQQWGLATDVNGDCIAQADGTSRCPHQGFSYDGYGNLTYYGAGIGNWSLGYDGLNRLSTAIDPDGPATCTWYNADGSRRSVETASERALSGNGQCNASANPDQYAQMFSFDADGNEISESRHFGCLAGQACSVGITQKWYDGIDRLIEVLLPSDDYIDNAVPWRTRYIYDMSQGGNVQISATNQSPLIRAYGNLFKTSNFFPAYGGAAPSWNDVSGNAFDSLDRSVSRFQYAPGNGLQISYNVYDAGQYAGLITSRRDALNETITYGYDGVNRENSVSFSDGSPSRSTLFDADGRPVNLTSSVYGSDVYQYDASGRLIQSSEASGGGVSSPATLIYAYYPDSMRSSLSISSSALSQNSQFSYSYRVDGLRSTLAVAGYASPFSWTYTNAGRMASQSDVFTGSTPVNGGAAFAAKSVTYNAYGQMQSLGIPNGGTYNNMAYDGEGQVTSFGISDPAQSAPQSEQITYDVRGELVHKSATVSGVVTPFSNPNGTQYGHPCGVYWFATATYAGGTMTPGARLRPLCATDPYTGAVSRAADQPEGINCSGDSTWQFDAVGRESSETWSPGDPLSCTTGSIVMKKRVYNAENRIASEQCSPTSSTCPGGQFSYQYDAAGRLRTFTSPGAAQLTAHWDGDTLLFLSDSTGKLYKLLFERLGERGVVFNQQAIYDRDFSGTAASAHGASTNCLSNTSGNCRWQWAYDPAEQCFPENQTLPCDPPQFPGQDLARVDGYLFGDIVIQGARAYDPSTAQWTAPDAYKGEVHDPMSQRSYMWNNNNPIRYLDPSGYEPLEEARTDLPSTLSASYIEAEEKDLASRLSLEEIDRVLSNPNTPARVQAIFKRVRDGYFPRSQGSNAGRPFGKFSRSLQQGVRGQECAACGDAKNGTQADHIRARSKGGGNTPDNLQELCSWCNPSKGNSSDIEWLERLYTKYGAPPQN